MMNSTIKDSSLITDRTFYISIRRLTLLLCCSLLMSCVSIGLAQANNLALARQKAQEARNTYGNMQYSIDQPIWREAFFHLNNAYADNPRDLDVLYYATTMYNEVMWDSRSWQFGREYVLAGGQLDQTLIDVLTLVGNDLGFSFYEFENYEVALGYYEAVNQINPTDERAIRWIARIYTETGNPEKASEYWRVAAERGAEGAQYFYERTQLELSIGKQASDAYYTGLELYQQGQLIEAINSFEDSARANPNYTEAWRWIGRTSIDAGLPARALPAWRKLSQLDPDDESVRYFITVAEEQVVWGNEAGQLVIEGLGLYEKALLQEANERFVRASQLNNDYVDAFRWAARTYQELGDNVLALRFWRRAQALSPDDESISYFIRLLTGAIDPPPLPVNESQINQNLLQQTQFPTNQQVSTNQVRQQPVQQNQQVVNQQTTRQQFQQQQQQLSQQPVQLPPAQSTQQSTQQNNAPIQAQRAQPTSTEFQSPAQPEVQQLTTANAFRSALEAYRVENYDLAINHLDTVLARNPDSSRAWGWLGRIHFEQESFVKAALYYEKAAELDPTNEDYQLFAAEAARLLN